MIYVMSGNQLNFRNQIGKYHNFNQVSIEYLSDREFVSNMA